MDPLIIPPQIAVIGPILLAESVITLKVARFLMAVFRAFGAKHAAQFGLKEIKVDSGAITQQRAYAYAETLMEVRIMTMLPIAGVLGVLWLFDVPSGRTNWLIESAYTATSQLFAQLILSCISAFFPDFVTGKLIECTNYPVTLTGIVIVLLLIADVCAHVANAAFLAAAVRNKAIAGGIFLFAVLLYKTLDKGLIGLGNGLRIQLEKQRQLQLVEDEKERVAGAPTAQSAEDELIAEAEAENLSRSSSSRSKSNRKKRS